MLYKENSLQYADYFSLRQCIGWDNLSQEQTIQALKKSLYDIVAIDKERVIGMGRLIGDGLYYIIADVIVIPEYQGKGIGSELIKRIVDYADRQTPAGSRASIQLIAAKGKEPFYEKMGFKQLPNEHCGAGMRKIIHKEKG
ncbi:GNAT superfamily N-acetyltransferase [Anaerotaenia torta]|uniref:GNAT family N-acetyltransferase n=1 Tax=Anaerotaenia torta TaxID=433293 RepID=UPI003D1A47C6